MGFKDTKWAYTLELTLAECAVLVAVCQMTDDRTHQTYASQETLARMSKVTRTTVNKVLGVLELAGLIERKKRSDSRGQRMASMITVRIDQTNVGEANNGEANVGLNDAQCKPDAIPTSARTTATSINQIDQPEDQPVNTAIEQIPARSFDEFWNVWPRKDNKKKAEEAWAKATKRCDAETIYEAAAAYVACPWMPVKQFVPHATTWLNGDRWNDPLPEAPEAQPGSTRGDRNLAYVNQLRQQETQIGITA